MDTEQTETTAAATKPIELPEIGCLPKNLCLWPMAGAKNQLRFVNPDEGRLQSFWTALGLTDGSIIGNLGLTDQGDIQTRLDLMYYLVGHQQLRNFLYARPGLVTLIPDQHEEFLAAYTRPSNHIVYWEGIRELIRLCREHDKPMPAPLAALVAYLETSLPLADSERQMADGIMAEMANITEISGCAKIGCRRDSDGELSHHNLTVHDIMAFGRQSYSRALNSIHLQLPYWFDNKFDPRNWFGLRQFYRRRAKAQYERQKAKAWQAMVIDICGRGFSSIEMDLTTGLIDILQREPWNRLEIGKHQPTNIALRFSYGREGLSIAIISFTDSDSHLPAKDTMKSPGAHGIEGFSPMQHAKWLNAATRVQLWQNQLQEATSMALMIMASRPKLTKENLQTIFAPVTVPSPRTDQDYRWFALSNLFESERFAAAYRALSAHRQSLTAHYSTLCRVAFIAEKLCVKAKALRAEVCQVELTDNEHPMVEFDQIAPIHLLTEMTADKIALIGGLPSINGQLVGLTGYHGGGKTTASVTVVHDIFAVQSGIPPLGRGVWRQNVKTDIGLVTVDRGRGSTCERLLEKMTGILTIVSSAKRANVFLVVDELGTGTQEDDGLGLGFDFLEALSLNQISTLFCTQIQGLARKAQEQLGATCFQVQPDYQIVPGIGNGGMRALRKRSGFDRALAKLHGG